MSRSQLLGALRTLPLLVVLVGLTLATCTCGRSPAHLTHLPLLDVEHAPDILVERELLEPPPSLGGNRFVRGWRGLLEHHQLQLVLAPPEAVLEVVSLVHLPRQLTLSLPQAPPAGLQLEVTAGGMPLSWFQRDDTLVIELPPTLPLGRCPVLLRLQDAAPPVVLRAALSPVEPAGKVSIGQDEINQAGSSLVEVVRWLEPGSRVVGSFAPPGVPKPGQAFALTAEDATGNTQTLFSWSPPATAAPATEPLVIDAELGTQAGLCRLRLLARGQGPPAHWRHLTLVTRAQGPAPGATAPPLPPRVVVLYILDALRADALGSYGAAAGTSPLLDELASEGAVLASHSCLAPSTLPSTKALLSGQLFLKGRQLPPGPSTLAEIFAAAGYTTAAFSGNAYVSAEFGTTRGFDVAELALSPPGPGADAPDPYYNDSAERVHARALAWLREQAPTTPLFLYLHTLNPHNPYAPPPQLAERFVSATASRVDGLTPTLLDIRDGNRDVTAEDRRRLAELYHGSVAYSDAQLEQLLATLEDRYSPGEVLVAITSDHGEELLDHDGVLHGYTLYDEQVSIPLLLWWPGHIAPQQVNALTDSIDLHNALAELVGKHPPESSRQSLWQLLAGAAGPSTPSLRFAACPTVNGGVFMARTATHKLVWAPRVKTAWGMGKGRGRTRDASYLFDLVADPEEQVNLAGAGTLEEAWLRSRLLAWIERTRARQREVEETAVAPEIEEHLKALGYVEESTAGPSSP